MVTMKATTTEEKNKVIGFFMGAKKTGSSTGIESGGVATEYKGKTGKVEFIFYDKPGAWTDTKRMEFHESYDWLVPAFKKFIGLKFKGHSSASAFHNKYCEYIINAISYKSITEAFDLLVEAVEWYNSINEKKQ